jgi:hypothetical protein
VYNKVIRRIYGLQADEEWMSFRKENFRECCWRRLRWAGHVAPVEETRDTDKYEERNFLKTQGGWGVILELISGT